MTDFCRKWTFDGVTKVPARGFEASTDEVMNGAAGVVKPMKDLCVTSLKNTVCATKPFSARAHRYTATLANAPDNLRLSAPCTLH